MHTLPNVVVFWVAYLQVSHHPPVTALHGTDEKENLEMIWCQHPTPQFYGTLLLTFHNND